MGSLSVWHWLVVAAVVLLLFGRGKVSELMGDVAKGIKAFKKGMAEDEDAGKAAADAKPIADQTAAQANSAAKTEQKAG